MKFAHFSHVWTKQGMTAADRYEQLWRELELADDLGFEYGFAVEHHFNPKESLMPSPSIYCAGAAAHTKRMRVGPQGYITSLYDPIRLVEEVAVLDNVLNGRLEVGLISGVLPGFFEHFRGADYERRSAVTQEFIPLVKDAFASDEGFDFHGEFNHYENVKLSVMPLQKPHPPIWRQTRDPEGLKQLAREGVHTGYILMYPRTETAPVYREYLRLWQEAGHPEKPNIGYWTLVYVDETDELAKANGIPLITDSLNSTFGALGGVGGVPQQELAQGYEQKGEVAAADIIRHMTDAEFMIDNKIVFVGSPETVARDVRQAAAEGCFNTLFCEFNLGQMSEEALMNSIRLFGTKAIPELHNFQPY